jgi:hypothetical protein
MTNNVEQIEYFPAAGIKKDYEGLRKGSEASREVE